MILNFNDFQLVVNLNLGHGNGALRCFPIHIPNTTPSIFLLKYAKCLQFYFMSTSFIVCFFSLFRPKNK